jgi:hypothetical protein
MRCEKVLRGSVNKKEVDSKPTVQNAASSGNQWAFPSLHPRQLSPSRDVDRSVIPAG